MKAAKLCGKLSSNETFFTDIWFSGVKTVEDTNTDGVVYCGRLKTNNKRFLLDRLENLTKFCPRGPYIVMNSTKTVPRNRPYMEIWYN